MRSSLSHRIFEIEPTGKTLGAVISGPRLPDYGSTELQAVKQAFLDYAVLIWPGQYLTPDEQMAFASNFGELVIPYLPFSNVDKEGQLRDAQDPLMRLFKGNEGWHTDSSFQMLAAKASMLTAIEVPSEGGETDWLDQRSAYRELDRFMKDRIANLCAYHSLYRSQVKIGDDNETTREALATLHEDDPVSPPSVVKQPGSGYSQNGEAPLRPLVKIHPETQCPALYIGRHAYAIEGLEDTEAQALLAELLEHSCAPNRVLTHEWQPGDFVMWDNRCVLHRARPWPLDQARVMHHTRVNGELESESALNSKRLDLVK